MGIAPSINLKDPNLSEFDLFKYTDKHMSQFPERDWNSKTIQKINGQKYAVYIRSEQAGSLPEEDWRPFDTLAQHMTPPLGFLSDECCVKRELAYFPFYGCNAFQVGATYIVESIHTIWNSVILNENATMPQSEVQDDEHHIIMVQRRIHPVELSCQQRLAILALSIALFVRGVVTFCQLSCLLLPFDYLFTTYQDYKKEQEAIKALQEPTPALAAPKATAPVSTKKETPAPSSPISAPSKTATTKAPSELTEEEKAVFDFYVNDAPIPSGNCKGLRVKDVMCALQDLTDKGCNDYIDWVFPTDISIKSKPDVPIATPALIARLKENPTFKKNFFSTFISLLDFYGLMLSTDHSKVTRGRYFDSAEAHQWLAVNDLGSSNSHAYRTLRVLSALSRFGYQKEASAFLGALEELAKDPEYADDIGTAIVFWRGAAKPTGGPR